MQVLLIDDHPLVRNALCDIIHKLDPTVQVFTADGPAPAFAQLAAEPGISLVLLDPVLSAGVDGFALLADLRRRHPALPVVVLAANDQSADMVRAVDLGAMGFVPKRSPIDELQAALALVLTGGVFIPQALLGLMQLVDLPSGQPGQVPGAGAVLLPMAAPGAAPQSGTGAALATPSLADLPRLSMASLGLTPRQTDVLSLLLKGLPNKLIARELSVSVDTVKDHVAAVLRALGVNSRTQAVLVVSRMTQQPGMR